MFGRHAGGIQRLKDRAGQSPLVAEKDQDVTRSHPGCDEGLTGRGNVLGLLRPGGEPPTMHRPLHRRLGSGVKGVMHFGDAVLHGERRNQRLASGKNLRWAAETPGQSVIPGARVVTRERLDARRRCEPERVQALVVVSCNKHRHPAAGDVTDEA